MDRVGPHWPLLARGNPSPPDFAHSNRKGDAMSDDLHTSPIPDPNADPNRDPEADPLVPPAPGHHVEEPQRPDGPPDKDPV